LIERYTLPEMKKIWTDENRFGRMLEVEVACAEAMAAAGRRSKSPKSLNLKRPPNTM
jgi:adenylosuccinate lyase